MSTDPTLFSEVEGITDLEGKRTPRIQNQYFLLTYKYHLPFMKFREYLISQIRVHFGKKVKATLKFNSSHELGSNAGSEEEYPHTHVVFHTGSKLESRAQGCMSFFDVCFDDEDEDEPFLPGDWDLPPETKDIHPNVKVLKSRHAYACALRYIIKYGNKYDECHDQVVRYHIEEEEYLQHATLGDSLLSKTPVDLIRGMRDIKDAPAVKAMIELVSKFSPSKRPVPNEFMDGIPLRQFQADIVKYIMRPNAPPYDRHIHWFWEVTGDIGKSKFAKWLYRRFPLDIYLINLVSKSSDFACAIQCAADSGWTGRVLLVDLSRGQKNFKEFLCAVEALKNGMVSCTKYMCKNVDLDYESPHVVFFANRHPSAEEMDEFSLDRWKIHDINHNSFVDCISIDDQAGLYTLLFDHFDKNADSPCVDQRPQSSRSSEFDTRWPTTDSRVGRGGGRSPPSSRTSEALPLGLQSGNRSDASRSTASTASTVDVPDVRAVIGKLYSLSHIHRDPDRPDKFVVSANAIPQFLLEYIRESGIDRKYARGGSLGRFLRLYGEYLESFEYDDDDTQLSSYERVYDKYLDGRIDAVMLDDWAERYGSDCPDTPRSVAFDVKDDPILPSTVSGD